MEEGGTATSQLAIDRAEEEAAFIARDKPEAAQRWLEDLFTAVDRLETFPEAGPIVPEIGLATTAGGIRVLIELSTE